MRIQFKKNDIRKEFFNKLKIHINLSWKIFRKNIDISKSSFDNYKSGKYLIPESIFLKLISYFDESEKEFFNKNTEKKEDNWGRKKGGIKAYSLNKNFFDTGRMIGIKNSKNNRIMKEYKIDYPLSKDICEFIGAFIGDGFFNKYRNKLYHIEFSGDSRYDLNYYLNGIIPKVRVIIPGVNPHIIKVKNKNSIRVIFYSKHFFTLLNKRFLINPGKKTYTIKIPDEIINSSSEFVNSTIRGIFDTDGCVFLDKRNKYKSIYPRISLQIVSKPLYIQLKDYLSKQFKLYTREKTTRNVFTIEIYGRKQLSKWMSLIGFSNSRHLNKIAQVA